RRGEVGGRVDHLVRHVGAPVAGQGAGRTGDVREGPGAAALLVAGAVRRARRRFVRRHILVFFACCVNLQPFATAPSSSASPQEQGGIVKPRTSSELEGWRRIESSSPRSSPSLPYGPGTRGSVIRPCLGNLRNDERSVGDGLRRRFSGLAGPAPFDDLRTRRAAVRRASRSEIYPVSSSVLFHLAKGRHIS
ncbi:hypothetical protein THAOC_26778, partial [Thalassiosira oceanica]